MERLRDGHIKLGAARYEHYAGQSKRNNESDENRYCEPSHAFECTRKKIGAFINVSRVKYDSI
jgi:hypothetical protein